MKTICSFLIFLVLLSFSACKPNNTNVADNKIVIGTIDSIYSEILNEHRKIWIYVPKKDESNETLKYPVVYLLDAEEHFYSVMGLIQQLSEANGNRVLPKMILVGIPNTDRMRDLSPSHITSMPPVYVDDSLFFKTSGGGENFTSFLDKELFPFIDSLYQTAPYRILIGHSLGGIFVINTLLNHAKLFNAYISIDPGLSWDNQKLIKQSKTILAEGNFQGTSLSLATSNSLNRNTDILQVTKDTTELTLSIRSDLELRDIIYQNNQNKLKFNWKHYKDDSHISVPLIAEYDGLRFIFDYYFLRTYFSDRIEPSYNIDSAIGMHYNKLSTQIGYKVTPSESYVNGLAFDYILYKPKDYGKAYRLLKMNTENYPNSSNAFASYGEILMLRGDTIGAIENYEKSLELNPQNENADKMVKKLKSN